MACSVSMVVESTQQRTSRVSLLVWKSLPVIYLRATAEHTPTT